MEDVLEVAKNAAAAVTVPAALVTGDGGILYANAALSRVLARLGQGRAGSNLGDILSDRCALSDRLAQVRSGGRAMGSSGADGPSAAGAVEDGLSLAYLCRLGGAPVFLAVVNDVALIGDRQACAPPRGDAAVALPAGPPDSRHTGEIVPWARGPGDGEVWFGAGFGDLLGAPAEVLPRTIAALRALIHPDDLAHVPMAAATAAPEAVVPTAVFRLRRADGGWLWVSAQGERIGGEEDGQPPRIIGSLFALGGDRQAEGRIQEALAEVEKARVAVRAREEMLRISGLSGQIGHWTICPERGDGWVPDETYRMLGYEAGEFRSNLQTWCDLIHPEDLPVAIERMQALIEDRTDLYSYERRTRHKDGSYHWYLCLARKVDRSDQGLPYLLAGVLVSTDRTRENQRRAARSAAAEARLRERLKTLAERAPAALYERRLDTSGRISFPFFNSKLPDMLGITAEEIKRNGRAVLTHIHADDVLEIEEKNGISLRDGSPFETKFRLLHPTRGLRWIVVSALPVARPDGSMTWYGTLVDITEQIEVELRATEVAQEMRLAHERLASIADNAPGGIFEVALLPDGRGVHRYSSARFDDLIDRRAPRSGVPMQLIFSQVDPRDHPKVISSIHESAATLWTWNCRFRVLHRRLGPRWIAASATPRPGDNGEVIFAGMAYDITADVAREVELRRAHELAEQMRAENERQAMHDVLTGLPNRRYYDERLAERRIVAGHGGPRDCILIRVDIDNFKDVNDSLGHEAGDKVLRRVADVLRDALPEESFAARVGGDEFSVLLAPGMTADEACGFVETVQSCLAEPLYYGERTCRFGASFGIAETGNLIEESAELQIFADAALYRAKKGGRNRMELFTPELHRNILNDRRIAAELHEAFDRDQFLPIFQPQFAAADGSLVGVETLLRWNHPDRGVLSPGAFMHVAEQLRIVPEIDRVMMEKTRLALGRWRRCGLVIPKISFNVSSGRMHDPGVVSLGRDIVDGETKVAFELLESILVEEESDDFKFHLEMLREAGIEIEIDDFGSGHASIIGVMQIAPSALKIDKRIVTPVAGDLRARNLVRAVVEIAETLGISTIAEGVESEEQARILREIGCDALQGYYFSRPLSEAGLLEFCAERRIGAGS